MDLKPGSSASGLTRRAFIRESAAAATAVQYREKLGRWMREENDTFEVCSWYRDRWTEDRNIIRGAKGGSHDLNALKDIIATHFPG